MSEAIVPDGGQALYLPYIGNTVNYTSFYGATIDLSVIQNEDDVRGLIGTGFSATCNTCLGYQCIQFTNGTGASVNHIEGVNNGEIITSKTSISSVINIGIDDCKNGADVVNKVISSIEAINQALIDHASFGSDKIDKFTKPAFASQSFTLNGQAAKAVSGLSYLVIRDGNLEELDESKPGNALSDQYARHGISVIGCGDKLYIADVRANGATAATNKSAADAAGEDNYKLAVRTGIYGEITEFNPLHENIRLQVGADATDANGLNVELGNISTLALGLSSWNKNTDTWSNVSLLTQNDARNSIDLIGSAIKYVSSERSKFGAYQNRLEHTINNLDNVVENTTAAESQIRDTDMALWMVSYSNNNILAQAGQAMLAQSNQSNQGVLALLSKKSLRYVKG